ncbi:MAG: asnB [Fibrobacteres bacterium]|nr:asnB [Fibrobacterota bacterium]
MCGIVGITGSANLDRIPSMLETMVHRGPDDSGAYIDRERGVALAMRRLSIIDLSGGHQPMSNEDDTVWVVCNGEIFNSPVIRKRLEAGGRHRFKTANSDVEVLLHLYEDKGIGMLQELNGMFAFVIYDKVRNLLFGARDRMGIKPLYYTRKGGDLAFASELKNLMDLPWVSRDIEPSSLRHYVSMQFVPGPESIFKDVSKLPAGCHFQFDLGSRKLEIRRYWDLDFTRAAPPEADRPADLARLVRSRFEEALERWTLSDVPIACSLSGGIDSSAVVGLLAKKGVGKIKTYSLGFSGPGAAEHDELDLARKVAEKWGTEHHELILEPEKLLSDLERMVWHLDEPYGGGLPSWYVYEFIAKDCKVAMTGSGGDELFGNYQKWGIQERPFPVRLVRSLRHGLGLSSPLTEVRNAFRNPNGHFYHRYLSDAAKDLLFTVPGSGRGSEGLIQSLWDQAKAHGPRNATAFVDFRLQLPEEFLLATDRFSMAHAVEARVPFLDHEFVEFAMSIPSSIRTRRGDLKYVLKEAMRDVLPPELLGARKKGFVLPLREWTRGRLKESIRAQLEPGRLKSQGLFSPSLWENMVKPHLEGSRDFTQQVWTFYMFQLWHSLYASGGSTRVETAFSAASSR